MKLHIFEKFDYVLIICVLLLTTCGIFFIYSSGINSDGALVSREFSRQIMWTAIGFIVMILATLFDFRRLKRYAPQIFVFIILVLLYTKFFGKKVNGARSWLGFGRLGIQPSEPCKLCYIIFLAKYLEQSVNSQPLKRFVTAMAIMLLPMGLILIQPDFGTATVYIPIFLSMCFFADVSKKYLLIFLGVGFSTVMFTVLPIWESEILHKSIPLISVLTMPKLRMLVTVGCLAVTILLTFGLYLYKQKYLYYMALCFAIITAGLIFSLGTGKVLKPYQIQRLIVFIDPYSDPRGAGWNIIQSKIAIGSGGIWGRGFLRGTQSHLRFLPEQSTDFIFSIFSEESGFAGGVLLFSVFALIMFRCLTIIKHTSNVYGILIVAGILGMFIYHFVLNVGMVMGIMPVAGIPLPFLSYGGSALLTNMAAVGLLMSVRARKLDFNETIL